MQVIEGRSSPGLALEALQRLVIPRQFLGQKLQRDQPVEFEVFRPVNHPHPAAAHALQHSVARDRAGGQII